MRVVVGHSQFYFAANTFFKRKIIRQLTEVLQTVLTSIPYTNSRFLHNPKLAVKQRIRQHPKKLRSYLQNMIACLTLKPKHDNPRMRTWRIRSDIRKVRIKRNDDATFVNAGRCKIRIFRSAKSLIEYRHCIMSGRTEQFHQLERQVLVQFESH